MELIVQTGSNKAPVIGNVKSDLCVVMCRYSHCHRAVCCNVDRRAVFPPGQPADGQQLDPNEDG